MNSKNKSKLIRRYFIYPLQAVFFYIFLYSIRVMPFNMASAIGSFIGRNIGKYFKADKIARNNLQQAFPKKTKPEIDKIIIGMWDNLGRVAFEWPQLDLIDITKSDSRVEIIGRQYLIDAYATGKSSIAFSAHMSNWEIAPLSIFQSGVEISSIYRSASNPLIDKLITKFRYKFNSELIPKGRKGARDILRVLANNRMLAMLVDQKLNEGLPVKFFGRDAMTPTAAAELSLRLKCPLLPIRQERINDNHFKITVMPPLELPNTGNKKDDVMILLNQMNGLIEQWIRQRPEQWFWVHNRWPN